MRVTRLKVAQDKNLAIITSISYDTGVKVPQVGRRTISHLFFFRDQKSSAILSSLIQMFGTTRWGMDFCNVFFCTYLQNCFVFLGQYFSDKKTIFLVISFSKFTSHRIYLSKNNNSRDYFES